MPLDYPLNNQEKGSIENAQFKVLKTLQLKGGLPVFSTGRDITINKPKQGEMWAECISGSMMIHIYYNGTEYTNQFT